MKYWNNNQMNIFTAGVKMLKHYNQMEDLFRRHDITINELRKGN